MHFRARPLPPETPEHYRAKELEQPFKEAVDAIKSREKLGNKNVEQYENVYENENTKVRVHIPPDETTRKELHQIVRVNAEKEMELLNTMYKACMESKLEADYQQYLGTFTTLVIELKKQPVLTKEEIEKLVTEISHRRLQEPTTPTKDPAAELTRKIDDLFENGILSISKMKNEFNTKLEEYKQVFKLDKDGVMSINQQMAEYVTRVTTELETARKNKDLKALNDLVDKRKQRSEQTDDLIIELMRNNDKLMEIVPSVKTYQRTKKINALEAKADVIIARIKLKAKIQLPEGYTESPEQRTIYEKILRDIGHQTRSKSSQSADQRLQNLIKEAHESNSTYYQNQAKYDKAMRELNQFIAEQQQVLTNIPETIAAEIKSYEEKPEKRFQALLENCLEAIELYTELSDLNLKLNESNRSVRATKEINVDTRLQILRKNLATLSDAATAPANTKSKSPDYQVEDLDTLRFEVTIKQAILKEKQLTQKIRLYSSSSSDASNAMQEKRLARLENILQARTIRSDKAKEFTEELKTSITTLESLQALRSSSTALTTGTDTVRYHLLAPPNPASPPTNPAQDQKSTQASNPTSTATATTKRHG